MTIYILKGNNMFGKVYQIISSKHGYSQYLETEKPCKEEINLAIRNCENNEKLNIFKEIEYILTMKSLKFIWICFEMIEV